MNDDDTPADPFDLLVIGAGIGGVLALHYARRAGLRARLLERQPMVGGLWAQLPPWQDIQIAPQDWALGDLPLAGPDQASIRDNIQAWVDRFGLAEDMRLGCEVQRAWREGGLWHVQTPAGIERARHLVAATGAHNKPVIPDAAREAVTLHELHSSQLRDAAELSGRTVIVVGGGASAYDLLDLAFEHGAGRVHWVLRTPRWMMPTTKPKAIAGSLRALARAQMAPGANAQAMSQAMHEEMVARYAHFGLNDILPPGRFDLWRDQLVPGRRRMVQNFGRIALHRGTVARIAGRCVTLSDGSAIDEADLLLWATGYAMDLGCFDNPQLHAIRSTDALMAQCGNGMLARAEPNLYCIAAGLDGLGSSPWYYALTGRTIASHIRGTATLDGEPVPGKLNHFEWAMYLAARDPASFPAATWRDELRRLALELPEDQALPIPE